MNLKHLREENISTNKLFGFFRIFVNFICCVLVLWLCIPLIKAYINIGMVFGWCLCLGTMLMVNIAPCVKKFKKPLKICYSVATVLLVLLIIWVTIMSVKIGTVSYEEPPEDTTVVVLGARVFEDGASESLENRLIAALDYLSENEYAMCVVTGSQGSNEPATEASVQREYLLEHNVLDARIIVEDESTSTYENFLYTWELLDELGMDKTIVISTQSFHQYRARDMAERIGFTVYSVEAEISPFLYPADFSREVMALTKYYMELVIN